MDVLILTPDELRDVTGYVLPAAQCRWLDRNGWTYSKNRNGRPIVATRHALGKLGVVEANQDTQPPEPMLNLKGMRERTSTA